jgi:hypothetical protein
MLARVFPDEYGRRDIVSLAEPIFARPQPVPDLSGSFPMQLSLGDGRFVDASEAHRAFTSFPRRCSQCSKPLTHDDRPADTATGQIVPYDNDDN